MLKSPRMGMGIRCGLAIMLPLVMGAQGQQDTAGALYYIQHAQGRESISLDGQWDIIIDPLETGFYSHRWQERSDGYFTNQQVEEPGDLVEYNFDRGQKISVPGDWNTQDERLYYYENTVWYKKDFRVRKEPGKRYFLHFGAVNYHAVVYVNTKKVGGHEGGYTSFAFEVTDLIRDGDNLVVVKVENRRAADRIPTLNMDWWNYGGITRSVKLLVTKETFIYDYAFAADPSGSGQVAGWVQLMGSKKAHCEIELSMPELKWTQKLRSDGSGRAVFSFKKNFIPWSPEHPKLYEMMIRQEGEELKDRIGFRSIAVKGNDILLNGKSIFLRGISIHEEAPFRSGRVSTPDECRVLLGWARELGCNFVRLAHYPHSEDMVRIAEEMGLIVWSEIPVYWTVQFENPRVLDLGYRQLDEMMTRDRNRANILLWSVANETPVNESRLIFLRKLIQRVRRDDSTRLVTAALDTHVDEGGYRTISDPLGEYLDVIGINSYCGWYGGKPIDCKDLRWKSRYMKPMIMSEVGAGALQGLHGGDHERWTEEYQDAVYRNNLDMLTHIPFLRGVSPWILTDFLSPRRPLPGIQDGYNRKGLLSNKGVKKKAFFTLREFYKRIEKGQLKY